MKKIYLVLIVFLIFKVGYGQTNVYHQFPDTNATWEGQAGTLAGPGFTFISDWLYSITGDTIIGSTHYKKIGCGQNKSTCACYRQDIVNRKVYAVFPESNFQPFPEVVKGNELLLYDFSLAIGDTLKRRLSGCEDFSVVFSIDSILIGNQYRRKINFDFGNTSIIEGIGSTSGLFEVGFCFEYVSSLCNYLDDSISYKHSNCSLNVSEIYENNQVTVFPNPFSTQANLQTDKLLKNATLTIENCFGQTVKKIENISGQTVTFFRDNIPSGLYFLRLSEDTKILAVDKLLITDN